MKSGEENILICTGFIGRLSETSTTKYHIDNNSLEKLLGTKGIQAIEAKQFYPEIYAGLDWKIEYFLENLF